MTGRAESVRVMFAEKPSNNPAALFERVCAGRMR